jgi:hypothetical protein
MFSALLQRSEPPPASGGGGGGGGSSGGGGNSGGGGGPDGEDGEATGGWDAIPLPPRTQSARPPEPETRTYRTAPTVSTAAMSILLDAVHEVALPRILSSPNPNLPGEADQTADAVTLAAATVDACTDAVHAAVNPIAGSPSILPQP